MSTRIVQNGRVAWNSRGLDLRTAHRGDGWNHQLNRRGELEIVPPDPILSPNPRGGRLEPGLTYRDSAEGLVYRVMTDCPAEQGWASTAWFQRRYVCDHDVVVQLAIRGLLDAAVIQSTSARYYRAIDEVTVEAGLRDMRPHRLHQIHRRQAKK